jgi:membrane fusion protein, copper/silver efflux system
MSPDQSSARAARPLASPFGVKTSGARWAGLAVFVLLLGAAIAFAVLTSRRAAAPPAGGHQHGAAAPASDSARPVVLSAEQARRIGVTFAPVVEGPLERAVRAVALVSYDERRVRTITTRLEGFVERLQVDYTGQLITAGQPLLSLYAPMAMSTEEELVLARRLARDVAGGTPEAVAGAQASVEAARQRLRLWEVPQRTIDEVERTGIVQRTITLRAPYAGYVLEKTVLLGQRVMPGDPLYKVADLSGVWLEGEIFERDLPALHVGMETRATFQALPGVERRGRIAYIYPTLNPETRTARVRVELGNADLALKPGMYATLQFSGAIARGLSVPRSAVLVTGERNLVFLKGRDGHLVPREVTLGLTTDERIQVLRGLSASDTVVASATFLVDAESNLASQLGGMGNMPGMDMTAPDTGAPRK